MRTAFEQFMYEWFGWILASVVFITLISVVAASAPGCETREHQFTIRLMEACTESCGARGVAVNDQVGADRNCVCGL